MPTPADTAAGAGHASGLPQFNLPDWPGQMVWVLIIFAFLYLMISRVFVPRISGGIDVREDRISGEIGDARRLRDAATEQSQAAAAELAAAKARARKIAQEALAKAKAAGQARREDEDARLAEMLQASDAEIAAAKNLAMANVSQIADMAAAAMIERLTGRPASSSELHGAAEGAS